MDIQRLVGRREFTRSLGTSDRVEAERKAVKLLAALHEEWDGLRAGGSAPGCKDAPTDFDLQRILADAYDEAVGIADRVRKMRFLDDPEGYDEYLRSQELGLVTSSRRLDAGDLGRYVPAASRLVQKAGFRVDPDSEWFGRFVEDLAEVTIETVSTFNRRDRGERGAKPTSEVLQKAQISTRNPEVEGGQEVSFGDLCDLYMAQWSATQAAHKETNTKQQKLATFGLFAGYWGNRPIRAVTTADAAQFHDKLKLLNPNWARSPDMWSGMQN